VKSEGCDLTSGVAVASDMGGSSRAKVIGALNSLIGGLTGRALVGSKVLQGSRQVFSTLMSWVFIGSIWRLFAASRAARFREH
jgi:hypothetical protein